MLTASMTAKEIKTTLVFIFYSPSLRFLNWKPFISAFRSHLIHPASPDQLGNCIFGNPGVLNGSVDPTAAAENSRICIPVCS